MAHTKRNVGWAVGILTLLQLAEDVEFINQLLPSWVQGSIGRSIVPFGLIVCCLVLLRLQTPDQSEESTISNTNTNTNTATSSPIQTASPNITTTQNHTTNITLPAQEAKVPSPAVPVQPKHNMQYVSSKLLPARGDGRPTVLVAYFKNVPIADKAVGRFSNAHASIAYTYQENSEPQISNIDPAKWMDQFEPATSFALGATKAVILAAWSMGRWNSRKIVQAQSRAGGYASRDELYERRSENRPQSAA
jgi:hypothetical protein